jgi:hypothetical protein
MSRYSRRLRASTDACLLLQGQCCQWQRCMPSSWVRGHGRNSCRVAVVCSIESAMRVSQDAVYRLAVAVARPWADCCTSSLAGEHWHQAGTAVLPAHLFGGRYPSSNLQHTGLSSCGIPLHDSSRSASRSTCRMPHAAATAEAACLLNSGRPYTCQEAGTCWQSAPTHKLHDNIPGSHVQRLLFCTCACLHLQDSCRSGRHVLPRTSDSFNTLWNFATRMDEDARLCDTPVSELAALLPAAAAPAPLPLLPPRSASPAGRPCSSSCLMLASMSSLLPAAAKAPGAAAAEELEGPGEPCSKHAEQGCLVSGLQCCCWLPCFRVAERLHMH